MFERGETQTIIPFLISADDLPEIDETLIVSLSNPSDGARIATGGQGSATVIISANDGVAGVVGLSTLSRSAVVGEGERVLLQLMRTGSAMGLVEVDWQITGASASLEFVNIQGTEVFQEVLQSVSCCSTAVNACCLSLQGDNATSIPVEVEPDVTPELEERFTLTLLEVRTISEFISAGSGAAQLDPQASTATITIRASNNPHGEVAFQSSSLFTSAQEGVAQQLTIVREFGAFGEVD